MKPFSQPIDSKTSSGQTRLAVPVDGSRGVESHSALIVPMVTPLTPEGRIDLDALPGLVGHLLNGGVDGLFLLGTTGEGPSLPASLGRTFVKAVAELTPETTDLYVCISDSCMQDALAMARMAARVGATAVVATAPFYYPLSDDELVTYFTTLASQLPLPLMLYNFPRMTGTAMSPEVILRLSEVPGIDGVKDSGGDKAVLDQILEGLRGRQDFAVYVGDEKLLSHAVRAGAAGGVCGAGNLTPKLFRDLLNAIKLDDTDAETAGLNQMAVVHRLFDIGEQWGRYVVNLKHAMSEVGLCRPCTASPLLQPTPDEVREIKALMADLPLEMNRLRPMMDSTLTCASAADVAVSLNP